MLPVFTEFLIGVAIVMAGSELLLRGGVSIAKNRGAGTSAISLIAVGLGLSAPILYTALQAAATGSPDMALGLITGSSILSLLLILGLCAYISPIPTIQYNLSTDAWFIVLAAGAFVLFTASGTLVTWEGLLMLAALTRYILYVYERRDAPLSLENITQTTNCSWCAVAYGLVGFGLIMTGADIVIDGSVWIARSFALSESAAASIATAAAVSLPVLIACLNVMHKKQPELVLPIVMYSTMFNILGATGLAVSITDIPVAATITAQSWLMLAAGLLLPLLLGRRKMLGTREGAVLIALFAAYGVYTLFF